MHNGLFPDMRGLLRMYDAGMGRDPVPREPPDPLAPRKSEHIRPLDLSADEIDALMAFMTSTMPITSPAATVAPGSTNGGASGLGR